MRPLLTPTCHPHKPGLTFEGQPETQEEGPSPLGGGGCCQTPRLGLLNWPAGYSVPRSSSQGAREWDRTPAVLTGGCRPV